MNNLYRKIAVTSVGIALSFALGANKEVKAATIILTPATSFGVADQNGDGLADSYYSGVPFHVGRRSDYQPGRHIEDRAFYESNIANLSLAPNTVISSAMFQVRVDSMRVDHRYYTIELYGYRGNGQPDASDYSAGVYGQGYINTPVPVYDFETWIYLGWYGPGKETQQFNFDIGFPVGPFVNELISKNNAFAGFSIRPGDYNVGDTTLNHMDASLIITTVDVAEPVPEPTTIFGSALALSLGGWLKRKNLSRFNKTTLQHLGIS